jgi:hypothetical protein
MGLAQLVRLLLVELIYIGLNSRFNMSVAFTANYSFSGKRRPVDSETFLVTDFVNLKIKSTQSFWGAHRVGCVYVHRGECSYVYEYLRLYGVSKKGRKIICTGYIIINPHLLIINKRRKATDRCRLLEGQEAMQEVLYRGRDYTIGWTTRHNQWLLASLNVGLV